MEPTVSVPDAEVLSRVKASWDFNPNSPPDLFGRPACLSETYDFFELELQETRYGCGWSFTVVDCVDQDLLGARFEPVTNYAGSRHCPWWPRALKRYENSLDEARATGGYWVGYWVTLAGASVYPGDGDGPLSTEVVDRQNRRLLGCAVWIPAAVALKHYVQRDVEITQSRFADYREDHNRKLRLGRYSLPAAAFETHEPGAWPPGLRSVLREIGQGGPLPLRDLAVSSLPPDVFGTEGLARTMDAVGVGVSLGILTMDDQARVDVTEHVRRLVTARGRRWARVREVLREMAADPARIWTRRMITSPIYQNEDGTPRQEYVEECGFAEWRPLTQATAKTHPYAHAHPDRFVEVRAPGSNLWIVWEFHPDDQGSWYGSPSGGVVGFAWTKAPSPTTVYMDEATASTLGPGKARWIAKRGQELYRPTNLGAAAVFYGMGRAGAPPDDPDEDDGPQDLDAP